jgi:hypothetical protein
MELGNFLSDDKVYRIPFGNPSEGGFVHLRFVARDKMNDLFRKSSSINYDPVSHVRKAEPDSKKFDRFTGECAVAGWEGLTVNGEEYPFTPENRDALMLRNTTFAKFVHDMSDDIIALERAHQEAVRGN